VDDIVVVVVVVVVVAAADSTLVRIRNDGSNDVSAELRASRLDFRLEAVCCCILFACRRLFGVDVFTLQMFGGDADVIVNA
jgi:hypothetical protein